MPDTSILVALHHARALSLVADGRLDLAADDLAGVVDLLTSTDGGELLALPSRWLLADLQLFSGDPAAAARTADQAAAALADLPPGMLTAAHHQTMALQVEAAVHRGCEHVARDLLAAMDDGVLPAPPAVIVQARRRAGAILAARHGDPARAREHFGELAAGARRTGNRLVELRSLVDAALLGADNRSRLDELARGATGALFGAAAAAGRALACGPPDALLDAADALGFLGAGAWAAALAAEALRRAGAGEQPLAWAGAARWCRRQLAGDGQPEGDDPAPGSTWARDRARRTLTDALTPSERRVSELAAAGLSNRDIAARLTVSRRTVENHLHRAYTKLGFAGREELAVLFADTAAGADRR